LVDAMIYAQVWIPGLVSGHINEDAIYRIAFDDFIDDLEQPLLLIGRVDGYYVKVVIDNPFAFRRDVEPVGMLVKNALVRATKIKPDDDPYPRVMTFLDDVTQHVGLHVGIGVMVFKLCGIKGHDPAGIDDERVGGKVLQIRNERVDIQIRLIRRQVGLNNPEVVALPPGNVGRPDDPSSKPLLFLADATKQCQHYKEKEYEKDFRTWIGHR